MISIGASAYNKDDVTRKKKNRSGEAVTTHADLTERRGEYRAGIRPRKCEQEDSSDAVERARLDEDPEDAETRRAEALGGAPLCGPPDLVADQQRRA